LVSGRDCSPKRIEELQGALPTYRVGLIVATPAAAFSLKDVLIARQYSLLPANDDHVFFASSAQDHANTFP